MISTYGWEEISNPPSASLTVTWYECYSYYITIQKKNHDDVEEITISLGDFK